MDFATTLDTKGILNYASDFRGRGRLDVVDPSTNNASFTPVEVTVHDARPEREHLTLDNAGFCFATHDCPVALDPELFETNLVRQSPAVGPSAQYEAEVAEFLKELTGAETVIPQVFGGLVARTSKRDKEKKSWSGPAGFVHLDFTKNSAADFLNWCMPEEIIEKYRGGRFCAFQTWRCISPGPQDNTLAICDGRSISPDEAVPIDMVVAAEGQPGGSFEIRLCRYNPAHHWYYLPNMNASDLLVFKAYDSELPEAMNAMHTGFDVLDAGEDAVPRRSIETRFYAFFK